jgi:EAL domain-containing protein (putative c-di-GMP-specific phosphodiesterase class I)
MVSMGQSLRLTVVATGIETRQQLAFLQACRCPEGQGHYFGQPMAAVELMQYLKRHAAVPSAPARRNRK